MAKIKESKLIEVLQSNNVSEGIIAKLINKIKKNKLEKEYEKLAKDPEYNALLKKYGIKPVY